MTLIEFNNLYLTFESLVEKIRVNFHVLISKINHFLKGEQKNRGKNNKPGKKKRLGKNMYTYQYDRKQNDKNVCTATYVL